VDQMRYKAFGESRDAGANLNTDHRFTSQIEDASIGLYWYNVRAYDPAIGRFTRPDTEVALQVQPSRSSLSNEDDRQAKKGADQCKHVGAPCQTLRGMPRERATLRRPRPAHLR
ncbi:MAG: hypothetical protein HYY04_04690, partial [Chloroflexi bacterium]|nr:hypothetical protein [Chloroflexota bacterium]